MFLSKLGKNIRRLVTACDMFSNTQLLRYKQNPQYKSANGGLCSIAIILVFAIIFTQTILNTFAKTYITSKTTLFEESEPTFLASNSSPFIFAVGVNGLNLNDPNTKYFDVVFSQRIARVNAPRITNYYTLQKCKKQDWVAINPKLGISFDKLNFKQWLCLPSNISLQFQGKYTSDMFKYVKISVQTSCSIGSSDNRTCASASTIDNLMASSGGYLTFNYYYLNTIINPDNSKYLDNYLEDRNYFTFTRNMGMSANVFISSYTITTDSSLWPVQDPVQDTGGIVYQGTQTFIYQPISQFISLYLRKSSLSLQIERTFRKYDDTFSYIGGLFSSIMGALFLMLKYNQFAYEIDIASRLYTVSNDKPVRNDLVNIFSFISSGLYHLLCGCKEIKSCRLMKQYNDVREEIGKQLDITFILNKLRFLQDCLQYLFQDYQLKCLHLKGKTTLHQAAKVRHKLTYRTKLLKLKKKYNLPKLNAVHFQNVDNDSQSLDSGNQKINKCDTPSQLDSRHQVSISGFFSPKNRVMNENKAKSDSHVVEQDEMFSDEQLDEDEQQQKLFFCDLVSSIKKVRQKASAGSDRCKKIMQHLDKGFRSLAQTNIELLMEQPKQNTRKQQVLTFYNLQQLDFDQIQQNNGKN